MGAGLQGKARCDCPASLPRGRFRRPSQVEQGLLRSFERILLHMKLPRAKVVGGLVALVLASAAPGWPQSAIQSTSERSAAEAFARSVAVKALTYKQGDRQTLMDAESDFTPEGWRQFMSRMVGFVDANGAPQGGSTFMPDGNVIVKTDTREVMQCDVPGTLRQTQDRSTTTYQVTVRIELRKDPLRIEHLTPTVCGSVDAQQRNRSQLRRTACP